MRLNIIADIAGRYNELMKLLAVMPKADKIVLVGDLVDRGPDSKKVVQWAMKGEHEGTPVITLKGNHEDMMVASFHDAYPIDHVRNGGGATLKSYGVQFPSDYPESHIKWMNELPIFFKDEESKLFVSHAPWIGDKLPDDQKGPLGWEHMVIWNRNPPQEIEGWFQVFGHNHRKEKFDDYAICIDNCAQNVLTGLHWPTKALYEVPYEDINK